MATHHFEVEDAIRHGVEKAVILYNLRFWLEKVKANDKEYGKHEGYYWTYNSAEAFAKIFPYYTKSKIHRMLTQLEIEGAILSGNFNKVAYDRTKWYTLPEFSILQNNNHHFAEVKNGSCESATPIPDSNPNDNPNVNTNTKETKKKEVEPKVKFSPTKPSEVSDQTWDDLLRLRKTKRAVESQTAWTRINNAVSAAQKATGHSLEDIYSYWVSKSWTGFDASWYLKAHPVAQQTNYQGSTHANGQSVNHSNQQQSSQQFDTSTSSGYAAKLDADAAAYFASIDTQRAVNPSYQEFVSEVEGVVQREDENTW